MTKHEQLVWMAGFFDGEGCVAICRQQHQETKRLQYQLQVSMSQKEPLPLIRIHDRFGGNLYNYKSNGVEYWRWCAGGKHARRFLEAVFPYLMLKQERAGIGIDFQIKITDWNKRLGRNGYPDYVHEAREAMFQQMKVLNQRGVSLSNPNPKKPGPREGRAVGFKNRKPKSTEKGEGLGAVQ